MNSASCPFLIGGDIPLTKSNGMHTSHLGKCARVLLKFKISKNNRIITKIRTAGT